MATTATETATESFTAGWYAVATPGAGASVAHYFASPHGKCLCGLHSTKPAMLPWKSATSWNGPPTCPLVCEACKDGHAKRWATGRASA